MKALARRGFINRGSTLAITPQHPTTSKKCSWQREFGVGGYCVGVLAITCPGSVVVKFKMPGYQSL